MHIQAAVLRRVENGWRQKQAVGGNHEEVERRERCLCLFLFFALQSNGRAYRNAGRLRQRPNRTGDELPAAPGATIRLAVDQFHAMRRIDQLLQNRRREGWRPRECQSPVHVGNGRVGG